jgi:hypothetical protein
VSLILLRHRLAGLQKHLHDVSLKEEVKPIFNLFMMRLPNGLTMSRALERLRREWRRLHRFVRRRMTDTFLPAGFSTMPLGDERMIIVVSKSAFIHRPFRRCSEAARHHREIVQLSAGAAARHGAGEP